MSRRSGKLGSGRFAVHIGFLTLVTAIAVVPAQGDSPSALLLRNLLVILWSFTFLSLPLIAIHELGHFLVARHLGWNVQSVRIWFLDWQREGNRFKFSIAWSAQEGGLVLAIPASIEGYRKDYWKFVLGGPAASALAGILALLMHPYLPHPFGSVFVVWSWFWMIVSTIPFTPKGAGVGTDGWSLWQVIRKTPAFDVQLRIATIGLLLREGTPLKDLPAHLFEGLDRVQKPPLLKATGLCYSGSHLWIQDRQAEALENWREMARVLDTIQTSAGNFKSLARLDLAMAEFLVGDFEAGIRQLEKVDNLGLYEPIRKRIEAIRLWKSGDREGALEQARQFGEESRALEELRPELRESLIETLDELDESLGNAARGEILTPVGHGQL